MRSKTFLTLGNIILLSEDGNVFEAISRNLRGMTMIWNYQRPKEKRKYRVYLCSHIYDYAEDITCEVDHREFVGETWAVSAAQAETNVRYRNGDKFNFDADEHGEYWYEAEEV